MADMPYSGAAVRAAHYAVRPSVAGINPQHFHPQPTVDLFNPQPTTPAAQAGDVWCTRDDDFMTQSGYPNLAQVPVNHTWIGQPAVQNGLPGGYAQAQLAMQERMIADHSQTNYVPDAVRLYDHAAQGQVREWVIGRMPADAGATVEGPLAYLANGKNGYDQTNPPNEVYAGDAANVGRYRLGVKTNAYGLYDNPLGKFGQDASLRAYTGLAPAFPVDKPPLTDQPPYNPNSRGTALTPPAVPFLTPSTFSLPSETALTDYAIATEPAATGDFYDDGSVF